MSDFTRSAYARRRAPRRLLPPLSLLAGYRDPGWCSRRPLRPIRRKWNSPFQTYKKEVCLPGHSMHPGPWAVCCECQTRFGGRLPVPRVEAALPYWVPLSLRPRKQMVRRQESLKGIQAPPLDACSWHNCWRICGDERLLPKCQQLQAPDQDELPARPVCLLRLALLTLLQAIPRVIVAIRQFFGI
uniref:uncharacterized protein C16orf95 homolog isoform X3 n=1 Tax=Macaca mulatta TaxID=9544 RepID=UPI0010A25DB2|nr:uncharacterized protein C16orf95 homolog isoform X3 [Macaca mulatta]